MAEIDIYLPRMTPESVPFWDGLRSGRVLVQRCSSCRRWTHPPLETCRWCGGQCTREPVSGVGTVYSFSTMHYGSGNVFPQPYSIAVVDLAEQAGLRMVGRLLLGHGQQPAVGALVQAQIVTLGETDHPVVAFRPQMAPRS